METKSLDDLLGGDPVAEPVEETVETVETEQAEEVTETDGPVRDERGRFAPKGVEEDAPPASTDQLPADEFKGLKDERRKRQEAEQAIAELRAELEALKNPPQPPAPPPDMWEDPQGWQQHFGGEVVSQASLNANLNMSEMLARDKFEDFDEVKAEFLALAEKNPTLGQQALADPHPWRKAYQIAKNHRTMSELGATDVDTLKAKLREEIMAEMAASAVPQTVPASISGERNVGSRSGPAWSGPAPLSELLR
jgi:hypothetical protein